MAPRETFSLLNKILILLIFSSILLLFPAHVSQATLLTYQRDYAYQASEADSKLSCRAIALEQVKRLLLEELGTYMESRTEVRNYQVSRDQIIAMTAGIVSSEILSEKWDGKTYVIVAKITADPLQVARAIDELRRERQSLNELEESKKQTDGLLRELAKLREELKSAKEGQRAQDKIDYQATVQKLSAIDWFKEGYALAESRKYRESISLYNKAIDADPAYVNAYSARGFAYFRINEYQQSLKDVNRALDLKPDHAGALANRARTLAALKQFDRALKDVNQAIELKPDFAQAYNIRAWVYLNLRNNLKALEDCNRAIELNPNFAAAYFHRGVAQRNMKRFDNAFKDFQRAIEIDPDDPRPYQHRGWTYHRLKKYNEAVRDFNKALELDPQFVTAFYRRGLVLYELKLFREALQDFSKTIELDKDYADAYYQRALCHQRLGQTEASAGDLKQAAELGHGQARQAIRDRRPLRDGHDE